MTIDSLRTRSGPWLSWLKDVIAVSAAIGAAATMFLGIFFFGIMAMWGDNLRQSAQDFLGITDLAAQVADVSGRNRVTRQPDGMTYVREPVRLGEYIVLVMHIGRTEVGAACRLAASTALYTDDNGVVRPGERRIPAQQLGTDVVRREIRLQPPTDLGVGRISLQLQLEYLCGDTPVLELTRPAIFHILEARS